MSFYASSKIVTTSGTEYVIGSYDEVTLNYTVYLEYLSPKGESTTLTIPKNINNVTFLTTPILPFTGNEVVKKADKLLAHAPVVCTYDKTTGKITISRTASVSNTEIDYDVFIHILGETIDNVSDIFYIKNTVNTVSINDNHTNLVLHEQFTLNFNTNVNSTLFGDYVYYYQEHSMGTSNEINFLALKNPVFNIFFENTYTTPPIVFLYINSVWIAPIGVIRGANGGYCGVQVIFPKAISTFECIVTVYASFKELNTTSSVAYKQKSSRTYTLDISKTNIVTIDKNVSEPSVQLFNTKGTALIFDSSAIPSTLGTNQTYDLTSNTPQYKTLPTLSTLPIDTETTYRTLVYKKAVCLNTYFPFKYKSSSSSWTINHTYSFMGITIKAGKTVYNYAGVSLLAKCLKQSNNDLQFSYIPYYGEGKVKKTVESFMDSIVAGGSKLIINVAKALSDVLPVATEMFDKFYTLLTVAPSTEGNITTNNEGKALFVNIPLLLEGTTTVVLNSPATKEVKTEVTTRRGVLEPLVINSFLYPQEPDRAYFLDMLHESYFYGKNPYAQQPFRSIVMAYKDTSSQWYTGITDRAGYYDAAVVFFEDTIDTLGGSNLAAIQEVGDLLVSTFFDDYATNFYGGALVPSFNTYRLSGIKVKTLFDDIYTLNITASTNLSTYILKHALCIDTNNTKIFNYYKMFLHCDLGKFFSSQGIYNYKDLTTTYYKNLDYFPSVFRNSYILRDYYDYNLRTAVTFSGNNTNIPTILVASFYDINDKVNPFFVQIQNNTVTSFFPTIDNNSSTEKKTALQALLSLQLVSFLEQLKTLQFDKTTEIGALLDYALTNNFPSIPSYVYNGDLISNMYTINNIVNGWIVTTPGRILMLIMNTFWNNLDTSPSFRIPGQGTKEYKFFGYLHTSNNPSSNSITAVKGGRYFTRDLNSPDVTTNAPIVEEII